MVVEILYKDHSSLTIENIKHITNSSTTIPNDWIHIYKWGDVPGNPSFRVKVDDIICVEARENNYVPYCRNI